MLKDLLGEYLHLDEKSREQWNYKPLVDALAKLFRAALHESELWHQPPSYLGYFELESWPQAYQDEDVPIALDFFIRKIRPVKKLNTLRQKHEDGANMVSYLKKATENFILDLQRNKPGYKVFKNLEAVILRFEAEGRVTVLNRRKGSIRNESEVRFCGSPAPVSANASDLNFLINRDPAWNPERIIELGIGAQDMLRAMLERFPSEGFTAFMVGDLGDLLKAKARDARDAQYGPAEKVDESGTDADDLRYLELANDELARVEQAVKDIVQNCERYYAKGKETRLRFFADWFRYIRSRKRPPPLAEWAAILDLSDTSMSAYRIELRNMLREIRLPASE